MQRAGAVVTPELAAKVAIHGESIAAASDSPGGFAIESLQARAGHPAAPGHEVPVSVRRRAALQRRLLGGADILAVTLTVGSVLNVGQHRVLLIALAMPLVLVPFKVAGLYDRDELLLVRSTLDEVPALLQLTALFALGVAIAKWLLGRGALGGDEVAALWLGTFAAIVTCRAVARWLAGRLSELERCLVIGDSERAAQISERIASSAARATVVASLPVTAEEIEELDGSDAIHQLVDELDIDRIVVVPSTDDEKDIVGLIRITKTVGVRVSVLPRLFEVVGSSVEFDDVDGMTMLGIRRFGLSQSSRMIKRGFDLVATSIGLIAVAPLMAAIALAVWLDSPRLDPLLAGTSGTGRRAIRDVQVPLDGARRREPERQAARA